MLQREIAQDLVPQLQIEFQQRGASIRNFYFDEDLADLLAEILLKGSRIFRRKKTSGNFKLRSLLMEENHSQVCPVQGCGNLLALNPSDGNLHNKLHAFCFEKGEPMTFFNCIGVCGACFSTGGLDRAYLAKKKEEFGERGRLYKSLTSDENEPQLQAAVQKLKGLRPNEPQSLSFKSLKISKKIGDDYRHLRTMVESAVSAYFPSLQEEFSKGDGENGYSFERLAMAIKTMFLKAEREAQDKQKIFDALVERICALTDCDKSTAHIIVSFFVQTCEVFHEISE